MSWTFHLQNINRSFERLASWYEQFMHRTELCFRALHERILYLEERQGSHGPTDEQVERVLRKILTEKFSSDPSNQSVEHSNMTKERDYFVKDRNTLAYPTPIKFDPATLLVDPESVPSKAYAETIQMLESRLVNYPHTELRKNEQHNIKDDIEVRKTSHTNAV